MHKSKKAEKVNEFLLDDSVKFIHSLGCSFSIDPGDVNQTPGYLDTIKVLLSSIRCTDLRGKSVSKKFFI